MIDKKEILKELESKFAQVKKELSIKPSFEDLEKEFELTDFILSAGFVSENFSRQLSQRIVDHYRDWHGYLNNLLLPNPSFLAGQTETKLFNSEEYRKRIWSLIVLSMKFSSMHSLIGLNQNKKMETDFINHSYNIWVSEFKPGIASIMEKVSEGWNKK
ncbi:hypothetical protein J4411_00595 [Candidatus Pacearchaeota archaeon]|nr:hypothetical protein [uncultured archaeon]MBS3084395.1 hypothetical protein [Candidatus Pacearchaeota archaeon]